jgi:hypothetical protein
MGFVGVLLVCGKTKTNNRSE